MWCPDARRLRRRRVRRHLLRGRAPATPDGDRLESLLVCVHVRRRPRTGPAVRHLAKQSRVVRLGVRPPQSCASHGGCRTNQNRGPESSYRAFLEIVRSELQIGRRQGVNRTHGRSERRVSGRTCGCRADPLCDSLHGKRHCDRRGILRGRCRRRTSTVEMYWRWRENFVAQDWLARCGGCGRLAELAGRFLMLGVPAARSSPDEIEEVGGNSPCQS